MRRFIRRVHLWLGLSLGLLFVLLGLTGSVLVFYTEIDARLNPEVRVVSQSRHCERSAAIQNGAELDCRASLAMTSAVVDSLDRAVVTVRAAFPDKTGAWRFDVSDPDGAIPARYYNPPETAGRDFAPMMVWLSPDGGQVLRRDYWGDYAMTFIYDLHYRLLLQATGGVILGYAGIALVLLLLSGLWAWWPRGTWRKALHYKRGAGAVRQLRDLHKLAGLWGLPLLLILSVTGVMLELPDESDAVLSSTLAPVQIMPHPLSSEWEGRPVSVATALTVARNALPDGRLAWVEVPGAGNGAYRFRMKLPGDPSDRFPHSFVWVDQYRGTLLGVQDARVANVSGVINNWLHPLHDGSFGGLLTRVLTLLAGLVPAILFWSGWRRWRIRKTPESL